MAKVYYKDDNVAIIHGDCIEAMSKLKKPFDACITDPPYGTTLIAGLNTGRKVVGIEMD